MIHEVLRKIGFADAQNFEELSPKAQQIREKYESLKEIRAWGLIQIHNGGDDPHEVKISTGREIKDRAVSIIADIDSYYKINGYLPLTEYVEVGNYYFRISEKELVSAPVERTILTKRPNFKKATPVSHGVWFDYGIDLVTKTIQTLIKDGHVQDRKLLEVPFP